MHRLDPWRLLHLRRPPQDALGQDLKVPTSRLGSGRPSVGTGATEHEPDGPQRCGPREPCHFLSFSPGSRGLSCISGGLGNHRRACDQPSQDDTPGRPAPPSTVEASVPVSVVACGLQEGSVHVPSDSAPSHGGVCDAYGRCSINVCGSCLRQGPHPSHLLLNSLSLRSQTQGARPHPLHERRRGASRGGALYALKF